MGYLGEWGLATGSKFYNQSLPDSRMRSRHSPPRKEAAKWDIHAQGTLQLSRAKGHRKRESVRRDIVSKCYGFDVITL